MSFPPYALVQRYAISKLYWRDTTPRIVLSDVLFTKKAFVGLKYVRFYSLTKIGVIKYYRKLSIIRILSLAIAPNDHCATVAIEVSNLNLIKSCF